MSYAQPVAPNAPAAAALEQREGLSGRMVNATLLSVLGQVLPLGMALLATPFVLRLLGPAQYGVFSLLTATLTYFVLAAGLGMGLASTRFASDALARGDEQEEVAVVWTTVLIAFVPSAVIAVALWFGAGHLAHLLHVPARLHYRAVVCFRIAAFAGMARIAANIFNTPQLARLKWSTYILVDAGANVLQVVLTPIVLLLWPNVIGALMVVCFAALAAALGQLALSARLQPALLRPRVRRSLARPLIAFGGGLAVSALANVPLTNAAQFLLAGLVSVREVAYYAVALSIASLLTVVPLALSAPLLPAVMQVRHNLPRLAQLYALALRLLSLWIVPAAALLLFAARPLISVWAGPRYGAKSTDAVYIMLVGVVLNVLDYGPQTLLEAHGRTRTIALVRLLELGPVIALTVILIKAFGVDGAALAWSLRFAIETVVFTVLAYRVTGLTPRALFSGGLRHAFALLVLFAPPGIAVLLGAKGAVVLGLALSFSAVHVVLTWRSVLTDRERDWVRGSLARRLPLGRLRWRARTA